MSVVRRHDMRADTMRNDILHVQVLPSIRGTPPVQPHARAFFLKRPQPSDAAPFALSSLACASAAMRSASAVARLTAFSAWRGTGWWAGGDGISAPVDAAAPVKACARRARKRAHARARTSPATLDAWPAALDASLSARDATERSAFSASAPAFEPASSSAASRSSSSLLALAFWAAMSPSSFEIDASMRLLSLSS